MVVGRKGNGKLALVRISRGIPSANSIARDIRDSVEVSVGMCFTDTVSQGTCGEIVHRNWDQPHDRTLLVFDVSKEAIGQCVYAASTGWRYED